MNTSCHVDTVLHPQASLVLRDASLLTARQSAYQRIELYHSPLFGHFYCLDGALMSTEADEFYYHENLVHPAALALPMLQRALVIGGGDGGSARQLLKYASLQSLQLAELDPAVVDMARHHLPGIHQGAFDDPRLCLHFGDGRDYLLQSRETFQLIVLDLTDPVGPAAPLYCADFFAACRQRLGAGGMLSLHLGSPVYQLAQVQRIYRELRRVFAVVRPALVPIPSYGGLWALALASDASDPAGLDPTEIKKRLTGRGITGLNYYNGATHQALFALPGFLRAALPD